MKWTCRGDDGIVLDVMKSIDLKRQTVRYLTTHLLRIVLVQRVLVEVIMIGVSRNHDTVDGRYLRGEVGGPFPGLGFVSTSHRWR